MKLKQVQEILEAQSYTEEVLLEEEILAACGCASDHILLLTGLVNLQVIRTAEMLDIKGIVFVRGKVPTEDMQHLAKEKQICLLSTNQPLYIACGKLYSKGLGEKGGN